MTQTTFAEEKQVPVNPSGGAKSTAADYSKFLMMLLNKGVYNDKRILSENSIELMRTAEDSPEQIKYAPKAGAGKPYALGSWIMDDNNKLANNREGELANVLASPGLFGTWPMIDYCGGYAYIFLVKNFWATNGLPSIWILRK
jgi:CubicO group peptidase (beta-lactamase class C family)